jgi:alanyl-tRNA synthetase
MNQFKPVFDGTLDPSSPLFGLQRAVNSQKSSRAGGKHNDLDDVGKILTTTRSSRCSLGTLWSFFGSYFKKEAIIDWPRITYSDMQPTAERLYASYFGGTEQWACLST